ncbi:MAG TPA: hypothetical protein VLF91_04035 [Candidatus Saccharimonadales bacterium]|nr:hypothetical protein [Candidatus Saccharimonadales bacterium]
MSNEIPDLSEYPWPAVPAVTNPKPAAFPPRQPKGTLGAVLLYDTLAQLANPEIERPQTEYIETKNIVQEVSYESGPVTLYMRQQQVREQIARGEMPPLSNGFRFVIDRRPAGQEANYIPAREFTKYFSQGLIPIADADHEQHDHDLGHVTSYQDMFRYSRFAVAVRTAAGNALASDDLCGQFTDAIDKLGDEMRNLESYRAQHAGKMFVGDILGAQRHLRQLAFLATGSFTASRELYDQLSRDLGVSDSALRYADQHDRNQQRLSQFEATFPNETGEPHGRRVRYFDLTVDLADFRTNQ